MFSAGIGKETARELARRGARVIMACRTRSTAVTARGEWGHRLVACWSSNDAIRLIVNSIPLLSNHFRFSFIIFQNVISHDNITNYS